MLERNIWCLLGLPIDALTTQGALTSLAISVACERRCFLSTPNLNFLVASQKDTQFNHSIIDSDLSVADGMPLIWLAKFLGIPLPERVAGSTLIESLHDDIADKPLKLYFFGGQDTVAEKASQVINNSDKPLRCVGYKNPGMGDVLSMSKQSMIDEINQANPDVLVVSLGAKKGQEWIQLNKKKLQVPVVSHLGAVVNFMAGTVERAPLNWQRAGFEWLWRIRQEPELWSRYARDGLGLIKLMACKVIPLALLQSQCHKKGLTNVPFMISCDRDDDQFSINLKGSAIYSNRNAFRKIVTISDAMNKRVILNCKGLVYMDSGFIGTLMLFKRMLCERNQTLEWKNLKPSVRRLIRFNGASTYLGLEYAVN